MKLNRIIDLPIGKSFFLFGPRQTGKTSLVKECIAGHNAIIIDLLQYEQFIKYKTNPSRMTHEADYFMQMHNKGIIFIDEIQKLPELLDEAHSLIEKYKGALSFILTGSSARKLKRVSTNLLAGRAWSYSLFPFTYMELGKSFNIDKMLQFGSLPPLLENRKSDMIRTLNAYSRTYLKEEIIDEALVRNIGAFSRFLELAADSSGEIVNFSNIARETGIASKTIKEYYQILEDTLIALRLEPFLRSMRKRIIQHSKYYLFDTGVINSLCGRLNNPVKKGTRLYGILFEHFIVLELNRLIKYREKPWKTYFWRTSHGAEVDIILEIPGKGIYAVEIKSTENADLKDLTGLRQFMEDFPGAKGYCVCTADVPYRREKIKFMPWEHFFSEELKLT